MPGRRDSSNISDYVTDYTLHRTLAAPDDASSGHDISDISAQIDLSKSAFGVTNKISLFYTSSNVSSTTVAVYLVFVDELSATNYILISSQTLAKNTVLTLQNLPADQYVVVFPSFSGALKVYEAHSSITV